MAPKRARKVKGLLDSEENLYSAEYLLAQRKCQETGRIEFCVKWKGYPNYHNTWEPEANILDPRLVVDFYRRLARDIFALSDDLDTTSIERIRDNDNDTSEQQEQSTGEEQIPKSLRGILKDRNWTGTGSYGSGGGGRKHKAAGRMGKGGGPKKKVKGRAAQPKKKVTKSKVTPKVKTTKTRRARYSISSDPDWEP